ncbi:MAG: DUF4886 domain-containing protein [Bacteroidaceae bacterium]|nr:DUF4886 domain-containing protein [Bacteroidaceae bacterium]
MKNEKISVQQGAFYKTVLLKFVLILLACGFVCMEGQAQTSKKPQKKVVVKKVIVKKPVATTQQKTNPTKTTSAKPTNSTHSSAKPAVQKTSTAPKDTTATNSKLAENQATATATDSPVPQQAAIVQTSTCGYLSNPPLPYMPVKLDVLFIGNSFSIDTSTALPEIFNSVGISNVNVYVLYKGGCSMKQHYEYYKSGEPVYELWQYNIYGGKRIETAISIRDVMRREPYDIVVFQQYSLESGDYTSYEPYLSKIIQAYNITKLSPRTTFAFNQTWAYSSKHKGIGKYGTQQNMYKKICDSVKKMKAISGIDVIIPCGTAVQNARNVTSLITENELTRDNQHIDLYMGRYLLACTFFEAIIAPCMGRNIRNDITIYGKQGSANMVGSANRHILQNCARLAVANNFEVSEFINP